MGSKGRVGSFGETPGRGRQRVHEHGGAGLVIWVDDVAGLMRDGMIGFKMREVDYTRKITTNRRKRAFEKLPKTRDYPEV